MMLILMIENTCTCNGFPCIHSCCEKRYYHLRSTIKGERFFAYVYFSNETVSQTTVSTGPMKMFRLEHETMNIVTETWHVLVTWSAGLTKLTTFSGFWKLGVIATSERWRR